MGRRLDWRDIAALCVLFCLLLVSWSTLYPEGNGILSTGKQTSSHLVTLKFVNTDSLNQQKLEIDPGMQNPDACSGTTGLSKRDGHRKRQSCGSVEIPYQFSPAENPFLGSDTLIPAAFDLHVPIEIVKAQSDICNACMDDSCTYRCGKHTAFIQAVERSVAHKSEGTRLHVVPVDPLAWMRNTEKAEAYAILLLKFAASVKSQYDYLTFKGSDYVFTCSDDNCPAFLDDLGAALSDGLGTRAIFAGVDIESVASQWPCPLRVINLNRSEAEDTHLSLKKIIHETTFMIHQRNRWICSDSLHPPNHWEKAIVNRDLGGGFMKEFGFSLCFIPKSGSTMTVVLLRRMMHYKNWNQVGTGINHGPSSGIHKLNHEKNETLIQAISEDLSFVKGTIVRNPITRLLSGYLDKIFQKKQYYRVPGLMRRFSKKKPPTFSEFVNVLIKNEHPEANHVDGHFRMQSSFCNMRNDRVDFIGKQDHLLEEIKEFGESLGFWEEYGASGFGENGMHAFGEKSYQSRTHDSGSLIWDFYTEELMHKVYEYYKEDFDRFGFSLDEILATNPNNNLSSLS